MAEALFNYRYPAEFTKFAIPTVIEISLTLIFFNKFLL